MSDWEYNLTLAQSRNRHNWCTTQNLCKDHFSHDCLSNLFMFGQAHPLLSTSSTSLISTPTTPWTTGNDRIAQRGGNQSNVSAAPYSKWQFLKLKNLKYFVPHIHDQKLYMFIDLLRIYSFFFFNKSMDKCNVLDSFV